MFQIRRNDNKNHTVIEETRAKKERHFIKSERIQKLIPVLNRYSLLLHVLLACACASPLSGYRDIPFYRHAVL